MGKAVAEYYNLEKVAEVLSVPPAEVNRLREQGKLRGLRDGNTWKFFKEEVHNYLAEVIKSRSGSAGGGYNPGDSDFDLGGSAASSSFDVLMEDAALPDDSDLISVAPARPASDLDLAALDQDDELALAEETQISSLVVPKKAKPEEIKAIESVIKLQKEPPKELSSVVFEDDDESSALTLAKPDDESSALTLAKPENDESSVLTLAKPEDESSALTLAKPEEVSVSVLEDEASVLGAGAEGSSPQLGLAGESGFDVLLASEEDILLVEEKTAVAPPPVIEEFELQPSPNMQQDDDSESSSQVIAIDAFAEMGQEAGSFGQDDDGFGGAFDGFGSDIQQPSETPTSADPFGTGPAAAPDVLDFGVAATPAVSVTPKPAAPKEEYSTGMLMALMFALVVLLVPGLMFIDLMIHMWSWKEPFILNSMWMDTFVGMFGL